MQNSKMITVELHKSGAISGTTASVTCLSTTKIHHVENGVEKQLDQCWNKRKRSRRSITEID